MNENNQLVRALGLKESISMTIGTVVGVGLFTCGSAQIGSVGSWIIGFTFVALLISIWPCLIYGEMSAALPCAGGTYNYAKRGLNRVWANMAGWHYIVSVVAIGAGETLAFANYFKILMEQLGISIVKLDSRIIAIILVAVFLILNFRGIEQSGKAQTAFMFFFWGCSVCWFLYMIPKVHVEYFGGIAMNSLPPFNEMMYIFGLVWWCYTGFETCVSMGAETKYPQYTLPRALKISVFMVFALNALFQWFLVGLVPKEFYGILAAADAPYAEGLKADLLDFLLYFYVLVLHLVAIYLLLIQELLHRQDTFIQWQKMAHYQNSLERFIQSSRHHMLLLLWLVLSILYLLQQVQLIT